MATMQELADAAENAPGWGKALFDIEAFDLWQRTVSRVAAFRHAKVTGDWAEYNRLFPLPPAPPPDPMQLYVEAME